MRTTCTDCDDMRDEYSHEAQEIAELANSGTPVRDAVQKVFDKWFWEDCLISGTDSSRLDAIAEKIASTKVST